MGYFYGTGGCNGSMVESDQNPGGTDDGGTDQIDGQWKRGLYMIADTPLSATPLALEEIEAGGIGEQMAWMSEAIEALGGTADRSEQATLAGGEQA